MGQTELTCFDCPHMSSAIDLCNSIQQCGALDHVLISYAHFPCTGTVTAVVKQFSCYLQRSMLNLICITDCWSHSALVNFSVQQGLTNMQHVTSYSEVEKH